MIYFCAPCDAYITEPQTIDPPKGGIMLIGLRACKYQPTETLYPLAQEELTTAYLNLSKSIVNRLDKLIDK